MRRHQLSSDGHGPSHGGHHDLRGPSDPHGMPSHSGNDRNADVPNRLPRTAVSAILQGSTRTFLLAKPNIRQPKRSRAQGGEAELRSATVAEGRLYIRQPLQRLEP
jgi:hypothetical protein